MIHSSIKQARHTIWFVVANSGFCESQSVTQSFTITNFPDLVIQNIQIPTMPFSGQSIQIDWEVHNIGLGDTENTLWYDRVYLSNTANIDESSVYLGAVLNTTSLNAGESYSSSILASIPKGYDGEYYIVIETDAYNRINEAFNDNNTNTSIINVTLTPPPDLVVNFVNIQSSIFSGENLTYSYQIKNMGTGVTTENYWQDHIFISESDLFDKNSAEYLGLNNFAGFNYGFDKEGNRLYKTNIAEKNQSNQYQYDAIYRLTNAKTGNINNGIINNPYNTEIYNYDDVGNRTSYTNMNNITNYVTNSMNDYTDISGLMPSYDLNGNLLNDPNHIYQYDKDNLLISVDNGNTATYKYDALRRRIQKITTNDTINFYYAGINLIEERNGNDVLDATYVHGLQQDELINMNRNNNNYFYHQDVLGSIYNITDNSGNIVESYRYDAYGNVQIFDDSGSNLIASAIENDFLYTGRRYDVESGLKYYRNRYYSCFKGRFSQRDPLGYIDGMAMTIFVENNPVNLWGCLKRSNKSINYLQ